MKNEKIIKLDLIKRKLNLSNVYHIFDMASSIRGCQGNIVDDTIRMTEREYQYLLSLIGSDPINEFYQRVKKVFENVLKDHSVEDTHGTYLLLLYFIKCYITQVDIDIRFGDNGPEVLAQFYSNYTTLTSFIALLNLLLQHSKTIIEIQNIKPIDLLYQILVMYNKMS